MSTTLLSSAQIHQEATTTELLTELRPLMEENLQAVCPESSLVGTWMDSRFIPMAVHLWIVRIDGEPVGYCGHIVAPHPFFGETWATCAAIYIRPAHRVLARRLIRQVEDDLAGQVAVISYSVPHLSNAGAFLETVMGYECRELVMGKRLV